MKKVKILGINFDKIDMNGAVDKAKVFINSKEDYTKLIVTANPEIVMLANGDKDFKNIINKADMVVADGIGVVKVSKYYGNPLPERVAGFDLMIKLIEEGYKNGNTFYFLGAKEGVVDIAVEKLKSSKPGIKILGYHHGYFKGYEDKIVNDISEKSPDILFVCLGAPFQEKFIYKNRDKLNAKLAIGLGGSFDVLAGVTKRSPKVFQKLHLEWLYRAFKEPKRFKRLLVIPKFLIMAKKESKNYNKL